MLRNFFYREVVGEVTDRFEHEGRTFFEVEQQDKKVCRGYLIGSQSSPKIGDRVRVYLDRWSIDSLGIREPIKREILGGVEIYAPQAWYPPIRYMKSIDEVLVTP